MVLKKVYRELEGKYYFEEQRTLNFEEQELAFYDSFLMSAGLSAEIEKLGRRFFSEAHS